MSTGRGLVWLVSRHPPEPQVTGEVSLFGLCWETGWSWPVGDYPSHTCAGRTFTNLVTRSGFKISHHIPHFSSTQSIAALDLGDCNTAYQMETEVCRLRNMTRVTKNASSRAQNREQIFHLGFNTAKTSPDYCICPDPQRDQPLGSANADATASPIRKTTGERKSEAVRRSEEGGEQTPAAQWLARDQLGSSDLLFALREELEAVEDVRSP